MYIVRDIFYLKFGHYRDVKSLLDEAREDNFLPPSKSLRLLTDFTGDSYRLVMESGFDNLADYENALGGMANEDWKKWYDKFKKHIRRSHREVLKELM